MRLDSTRIAMVGCILVVVGVAWWQISRARSGADDARREAARDGEVARQQALDEAVKTNTRLDQLERRLDQLTTAVERYAAELNKANADAETRKAQEQQLVELRREAAQLQREVGERRRDDDRLNDKLLLKKRSPGEHDSIFAPAYQDQRINKTCQDNPLAKGCM